MSTKGLFIDTLCKHVDGVDISKVQQGQDGMEFRADIPFNALAPLPPVKDVETRETLRACISARAALAETRMAGKLIPNQSILINSIPLLEAQASSEIENIVTTTDRLFRYAQDPSDRIDPATKEALRYRKALFEGFASLAERPVSATLATMICGVIKGRDMPVRAVPGTALFNDATGDVIYTPPAGRHVITEKLSNWERYIHEADEIDPLIRMAIMHYQFEAIHPFTDGNGRTGRILNLLFLVDKGLLDIPVLYLSRHIIQRKPTYYRLLLDVTTMQAWEPWILFMLDAVRETARWTTSKIMAVRSALDETAIEMRKVLPKIYSRELVEIIFAQPYCRIGNLVSAGIAKRQSASIYLKALASAGIVDEVNTGREKLFINPRLIGLLREPSSTGP